MIFKDFKVSLADYPIISFPHCIFDSEVLKYY